MNFKINALLAVWLTGLIVGFWTVSLYFGWDTPGIGEIRGVTAGGFLLIIQYFYRKKPPKGAE